MIVIFNEIFSMAYIPPSNRPGFNPEDYGTLYTDFVASYYQPPPPPDYEDEYCKIRAQQKSKKSTGLHHEKKVKFILPDNSDSDSDSDDLYSEKYMPNNRFDSVRGYHGCMGRKTGYEKDLEHKLRSSKEQIKSLKYENKKLSNTVDCLTAKVCQLQAQLALFQAQQKLSTM